MIKNKFKLLNVFVIVIYSFVSLLIIMNDINQILLVFSGFILIWILILANNKFFENLNLKTNKIYNKMWFLGLIIIALTINIIWSILNKTVIFPLKIYADPLTLSGYSKIFFVVMNLYFIDILILLIIRFIMIIVIIIIRITGIFLYYSN